MQGRVPDGTTPLSSFVRAFFYVLLWPLYLAASAAHAQAGDVLERLNQAFKANDCARLGAAVNEGIASGNPATLYFAGLMFDEGICVEPDAARAERFYRSAESPGDWKAARDIGLRFALGDGLRWSYERARIWLAHAERLNFERIRPAGLGLPASKVGLGLPAPKVNTPDAEWLGYLEAIRWVAGGILRFPTDALDANTEAETWVEVCPLTDSVTVSFDGPPESATGTRLSRRAPYVDALSNAYKKALTMLPRPKLEANPKRMCFKHRVDFRIVTTRG